MTDDIKHGITITEAAEGALPIATASSAVIGLVAVSTDADADAFPLDTAVLVANLKAAIGKAGVNGTLALALKAIADICSPTIIVVRVAPGMNEAATSTAIIGTVNGTGKLTGMQALLTAESKFGIKPTILGVPGHDSETVTTALAVVSHQLRGFVYAAGIGAVVADVLTYAEGFSDRDLMLIWPDFTDWAGSAVARAMGLRAFLDQTRGFNFSLSNNVVPGVTGITKDVDFDILDSTCTAGTLNAGNVTTIVRYGGGYRFWGNRTCSTDPDYVFEVATRSANVVRDTIAYGIASYIDLPITVQWVQDVLGTINAKLRSFVSRQQLIGANCWFDSDLNSAEDLAGGNPNFDFDFTITAPAENIGLTIHITDKYYDNFAAQLTGAG